MAIVNTAGIYSVTVISTTTGCFSVISTTVTSNTNTPTVTLSSNLGGTLTCAQTSLTVTATGGTSYVFVGPGTSTLGIVSQNAIAGTAVVNTAGAYSVTATADNGCTATNSVTIDQDTNIPTASIEANTTLTCAQTTAILTASGGDSYLFSGPGLIATAINSATVNVGGLYSVTVTNAATGCSSITNTTVYSNTTAPAIPTLTASDGGTLTCSTTTLTLIASATGSGLSYEFSGPGFVSQQNNVATVSAEGSYSVVITGSNSCTSLATTTVFNNTIAPSVSLLPTSTTITCLSPTVTLTGTAGLTNYAFSNGQSSSSNTATISSAGAYSDTHHFQRCMRGYLHNGSYWHQLPLIILPLRKA